ncbi:hypothetical protein MRB53_000170 [Persea americana]|uniref:Uncharacterized protein n=1 Tax=Persea americana TaxID=3435 RepID=A0ACC2MQG2_PERAE|nr:hypothetical protein MRB53_000170 [Persea americana]
MNGKNLLLSLDWDKDTCPVMLYAVFSQGKLYALNEDGGFSVVDSLFPHDFTILKMKLEDTIDSYWYHKAVMLESCGEILLVLRVGGYWKRNVAVFRANLTELEWVNVENLGDRRLLLFPESSFSKSSIGTDFRSNCVYYFSYKTGVVQYKEFELGGDGWRPCPIPLFDDGVIDDEYGCLIPLFDDGVIDDEYGVTNDDS